LCLKQWNEKASLEYFQGISDVNCLGYNYVADRKSRSLSPKRKFPILRRLKPAATKSGSVLFLSASEDLPFWDGQAQIAEPEVNPENIFNISGPACLTTDVSGGQASREQGPVVAYHKINSRPALNNRMAFEKPAVKQGSGKTQQHKTCLSDAFHREFFVLETADAVFRMFFKKP
jgi:hypothetical protein